MNRVSKISILASIALSAFQGCGKDNPSAPGDDGDGIAGSIHLSPEPCMATFTESYSVSDGFGDEEFSVKAGDSFIVRSLSGFFHPELYSIFKNGAYEFEVKSDSNGGYPFTSNCAEGKTDTYLAAFQSTTVYSDSTLTQPLCTLSKGSTAPADGPTGYYLVGDFFSAVYHVELGGFASECKGADGGYVAAPEADAFGATTNLIPINSYESPAD